jgi:hypothetical protein
VIPVPLVIDQQTIMALIVMYGLMPKADKRQFRRPTPTVTPLVLYDVRAFV